METTHYTGSPFVSADEVRRWYAEKTRWLLDKYGPVLRVHFHTGLVSPGVVPAVDASALSRQLAEAARKFDAYWLSRVGTRDGYIQAAEAAGFELVRHEDLTEDAARWYDLSVEHARALVREQGLAGEPLAARERSISWQSELAVGYRARRFEDLLLLFRLR